VFFSSTKSTYLFLIDENLDVIAVGDDVLRPPGFRAAPAAPESLTKLYRLPVRTGSRCELFTWAS
jgi:hypothetical protein